MKQEKYIVEDDPTYEKVGKGVIVASDREALNAYREKMRKKKQNRTELGHLKNKYNDLEQRVKVLERILLSKEQE